jgi:hypothetical protein
MNEKPNIYSHLQVLKSQNQIIITDLIEIINDKKIAK